MKNETWKTLAIVFITLFVVETIIVIGLFIIGLNEINNEKQCADICYDNEDAGFYYFEDGRCYCLNGEQEVVVDFMLE